MFMQSLLFVIQSVADIFAMTLLARFAMQWGRVSFRNPLGQFVIAVTDWVVRPARKMIPGLFGVDMASLLLAWLVEAMYIGLVLGLSGLPLAHGAMVAGTIALVATVETARLMLHLLFGVIIITV